MQLRAVVASANRNLSKEEILHCSEFKEYFANLFTTLVRYSPTLSKKIIMASVIRFCMVYMSILHPPRKCLSEAQCLYIFSVLVESDVVVCSPNIGPNSCNEIREIAQEKFQI